MLFLEEFMTEALNVVAIIVAGLMVGCELAIAAFVHPTLDRLPDDVHLPAASALARVQGRFMPFWYILVFLLTLAEVIIQWHQSGRLPIWIATSAVLWVLAILYSVTALVPINDRIKSNPPLDWKTYRRRWDLLHRWRVVLLTIAFAFLIVGFVSKQSSLASSAGATIAGDREPWQSSQAVGGGLNSRLRPLIIVRWPIPSS
jgi:uncharacterized membrane protein